MPERTTYWVCSCGTAVDRSLAACQRCGYRRPRHLRAFLAVASLVILVWLLTLFNRNVDKTNDLHDLSPIEAAVSEWTETIKSSSNSVAATERLRARDRELFAKFGGSSKVISVEGNVTGITPMHKGSGVSVSIGQVTLIAGVNISMDVDTLVKESDSAHMQILSLSVGDRVRATGIFPDNDSKSLVVVNFSGSSAVDRPSYLFRFNDITILKN
jgi:hypothetical protein